MTNQFFYIRTENSKNKEGVAETTDYTDSFNLDLVIRSVEMEDGRRLVLLSDIHERLEKVPQFNSKRDKITGYTKERNTFQSEIYLQPDDNKRFMGFYNYSADILPFE